MHAAHVLKIVLNALVVATMVFTLSGCIKETSEDADVLEDAGTQDGAAIVVDPDDE